MKIALRTRRGQRCEKKKKKLNRVQARAGKREESHSLAPTTWENPPEEATTPVPRVGTSEQEEAQTANRDCVLETRVYSKMTGKKLKKEAETGKVGGNTARVIRVDGDSFLPKTRPRG